MGTPEELMSEFECRRCGVPTEPPGYSVPLFAMLLLFLVGGTGSIARTGYCPGCARFGTLITILACGILVIVAIVVSVVLS